MESFCETVKLNALLHHYVECVARNHIIYIEAFPSNTYIGYSYNVEVVKESVAIQRLNTLLEHKRVETVKSQVALKHSCKSTNNAPISIIVFKDIQECSRGKIKTKYRHVPWVSTCTWMQYTTK